MKAGSQDRAQPEITHADVWNEAIEAAAVAAEAPDRRGREWVPGSLWDAIKQDTASDIRKLKQDDQARAEIGGGTGNAASFPGGQG